MHTSTQMSLYKSQCAQFVEPHITPRNTPTINHKCSMEITQIFNTLMYSSLKNRVSVTNKKVCSVQPICTKRLYKNKFLFYSQ